MSRIFTAMVIAAPVSLALNVWLEPPWFASIAIGMLTYYAVLASLK